MMNVHVISSDSDDSQLGSHFNDKPCSFSTMKIAFGKPNLTDSLSSDEEEFVPLHERLFKNCQNGSNSKQTYGQSVKNRNINELYSANYNHRPVTSNLPNVMSRDGEPITTDKNTDRTSTVNQSSDVVEISSDSEVASVTSSGSTTSLIDHEITVIRNVQRNSNSDSEECLPDLERCSTSSSVISTDSQALEELPTVSR